jgi:hypothetical protein
MVSCNVDLSGNLMINLNGFYVIYASDDFKACRKARANFSEVVFGFSIDFLIFSQLSRMTDGLTDG